MSSMKNLSFLLALMLLGTTLAFQVLPPPQQHHHVGRTVMGMVTTDETITTAMTTPPFFAKWEDSPEKEGESSAMKSLETKMANWEASPEEIKAATLGGVTPGGLGGGKKNGGVEGSRGDGFDVGLYIAFPFMILGSLLFAFFPLIMDKIDVSSVGPPPMM